MNSSKNFKIIDALYGEVEFSEEIFPLLWVPLIQRLRHIRLSNIDSFSMPGIANISRYEHSIGVGFLATKVPFFRNLSKDDTIIFQAAALLHDNDITPFGHLVQEAFEYVSAQYEHEKVLFKVTRGIDSQEIGGLKRQLLSGREIGIDRWASKVFGAEGQIRIDSIFEVAAGGGKYGQYISSNGVDLDNLDNVLRIAYHMGFEVDRLLPVRVAQGMEISTIDNAVIFHASTIPLLEQWLSLRKSVYSCLMLSRVDFAAKAMLIQAAIWAYENGIIGKADWGLTDITFIQRLLISSDKKIKETIRRWMAGELWELSDVFWLSGAAPEFKDLLPFNETITKKIGRECFAYRIKDKRTRELNIQISDGHMLNLGRSSDKWLLGVVSPKRKEFSSKESLTIKEIACELFDVSLSEELTDNTLTLPIF